MLPAAATAAACPHGSVSSAGGRSHPPTWLAVEHACLVPLRLGPAHIHPLQHLSPVLGVGAARARLRARMQAAVLMAGHATQRQCGACPASGSAGRQAAGAKQQAVAPLPGWSLPLRGHHTGPPAGGAAPTAPARPPAARRCRPPLPPSQPPLPPPARKFAAPGGRCGVDDKTSTHPPISSVSAAHGQAPTHSPSKSPHAFHAVSDSPLKPSTHQAPTHLHF